MVGDEVVDIVTALPPSHGQTTAQIANEYSNERVHDDVVGESPVARVMSGEHDLMPEQAQEAG